MVMSLLRGEPAVIDEAAHERGLRLVHEHPRMAEDDASSMKPRMNAD